MRCSTCGAQNEDRASRCNNCGMTIRAHGWTSIVAICVVVLAVAGGGIYFGLKSLSSEGPCNYVFTGEIADEVSLFHNVQVSYATDRSDTIPPNWRSTFDKMEFGPSDRLYRLRLTKVEYDTTWLFKTIHHIEDISPDNVPSDLRGTIDNLGLAEDGMFIHEGKDVGDMGWTFIITREGLERVHQSHTLRDLGVMFTFKQAGGEERTIERHLIHNLVGSDVQLVFKPSK